MEKKRIIVALPNANHSGLPMFKTDKVYILPCDGIAGEEIERREIPLTGYFAVKFGKGRLERALSVSLYKSCGLNVWEVFLDGNNVAPRSQNWRLAFGEIYDQAQKYNGILLGRPLGVVEYMRLIKSRRSDKENGIDLSDSVDLNHVQPPTFRSK